jgi:hypothetical protein
MEGKTTTICDMPVDSYDKDTNTATFRLGTVADLREYRDSADVVAAASLLAVLADKEAGLRSLWS